MTNSESIKGLSQADLEAMDKELKPCPFCGGEAIVCGVINSDITRIVCGCGSSFTHERKASRYTLKETIDAWNYRPIEDALKQRIAELCEVVHEAIVQMCSACPAWENDHRCRQPAGTCYVQQWIKVEKKARGEK